MCCFDIMLSFGISEAVVAFAVVAPSLARGERVLPLQYHSSLHVLLHVGPPDIGPPPTPTHPSSPRRLVALSAVPDAARRSMLRRK